MKELLAEEIEAERGQRAEDNREELESDDIVAEYPDGERLKIDEKPFATEIGWIKKLELVRFESMERIDAIGGFIRVESDRNRVEMIDTEEECESEERCEQAISQSVRTDRCAHNIVGEHPICRVAGRASHIFHFSLSLCYHYTEIKIKNK